MSILFKGNLEEGNYTLIKSTDGWVLKGETSYVGFNFADRPQGEWIEINKEVISIPIKWSEADKREPIYKAELRCSVCGFQKSFIDGHTAQYNFCPNCGADMRKETIDYEHVVLTCDDEGNWSMHGERKEGE